MAFALREPGMTTKRDGLTSTAATGILYGRGIEASRDRIARMSDLLFDAEELRRGGGGQRRFTPAQVEVLGWALSVLEETGLDLAEVERAMAAQAGGGVAAFHDAVMGIHSARKAAVERFAAYYRQYAESTKEVPLSA